MSRTLLAMSAALCGSAGGCGDELPPPPPQPVRFSHKVHAGDNKIGCTLCHAYAMQSPVAGIPSAARCNGCHKFVDRDKPEVQVVNKAFEDGKPLAWNRVHRVPDHVYFTHQRHLAAGLRCQECHGDVATMEVVRQVSPLTMGWCVDCHQARKAPLDCLTCHK
jgi:cytochrome c7-like protein/class III cytochrome C family protein